jgi:GNAT superfamily N-acetyltransferase
MFVREEYRNRGVCARLMARIIRAAEERDCVRLVVSPSSRAAPFYGRAGFVVPDEMAGEHRLLVRPSTS